MEHGWVDLDMEKAQCAGQMELTTMENGSWARLMEEVLSTTAMETSMWESTDTTERMDGGSTRIRMEPNMKESGGMTCSMGKEWNCLQMDQSTKADMLMEKKKDSEHILGPMALSMWVSGWTTGFMGLEHTPGRTDVATTATGTRTICKV